MRRDQLIKWLEEEMQKWFKKQKVGVSEYEAMDVPIDVLMKLANRKK